MKSIDLAIRLLAQNENSFEDKEAIQFLVENGISNYEAIEIITFLPIAFVRRWLNKLNWKETYIENQNGKFTEKKFNETESYTVILKIVESYFERNPTKETVMKIAGRSAELQVMNKLLIENPESKIEDIKLSETIIMR